MNTCQRKLFRSIIHGLSTPEEILSIPELPDNIRNTILPLAGQCDDSLLFKKSFENLTSKPTFDHIVIENKFDISELELEYLFKLARFGVEIKFEFFKDESNISLDFIINRIANKIESHFYLDKLELVFNPFKKPPKFYYFEAQDLVCEARFVAQIIDGFENKKNIALTMRTIDRRTLIFKDAISLHGIDLEIIELSKLPNREFDIVFVLDSAHDRLTLFRDPDELLKDSDCLKINCLLGKNVLRPFKECYIESNSLPSWQSIEPIWFLKAAHLAKESLIVTSSALDDQYRPQSMSELIKLNWFGRIRNISELKKKLNCLEQKMYNVKYLNTPLPRGQINPIILKKKFKNKLGLVQERAITPTIIKAFAECPFKAFVEQILEINLNTYRNSIDIDPRIIGTMAHSVLRKYYQFNKSISESVMNEYNLRSSNYSNDSLIVFQSIIEFLEERLKILVLNIAENAPIAHAIPIKFEFKFKPIPFKIKEDIIFMSGIADRIDTELDTGIVVEYKLSSLSESGLKFSILRQIQTLIYLRLLGNEFSTYKNILGYSISVYKGCHSRILNMTIDKSKELDEELKKIFSSILDGLILSTPGKSCINCKLKRLCGRYKSF